MTALRRRLHKRKLQEGKQGINTDPAVLTEIEDLTARIAALETPTQPCPRRLRPLHSLSSNNNALLY